VTVAAPAAASAASDSKTQLGFNLLPMLIGKAKGDSYSRDLKPAYGISLHFDYAVIPGLTVGLAPQALFNVKPNDLHVDASKEYDLMARVAYSYTVAPKVGIYAEVLPGYSIISAPPGRSGAKGLVLAGGVGVTRSGVLKPRRWISVWPPKGLRGQGGVELPSYRRRRGSEALAQMRFGEGKMVLLIPMHNAEAACGPSQGECALSVTR
jgi:hypothetical protein